RKPSARSRKNCSASFASGQSKLSRLDPGPCWPAVVKRLVPDSALVALIIIGPGHNLVEMQGESIERVDYFHVRCLKIPHVVRSNRQLVTPGGGSQQAIHDRKNELPGMEFRL